MSFSQLLQPAFFRAFCGAPQSLSSCRPVQFITPTRSCVWRRPLILLLRGMLLYFWTWFFILDTFSHNQVKVLDKTHWVKIYFEKTVQRLKTKSNFFSMDSHTYPATKGTSLSTFISVVPLQSFHSDWKIFKLKTVNFYPFSNRLFE